MYGKHKTKLNRPSQKVSGAEKCVIQADNICTVIKVMLSLSVHGEDSPKLSIWDLGIGLHVSENCPGLLECIKEKWELSTLLRLELAVEKK